MYVVKILEPRVINYTNVDRVFPTNEIILKLLASTICGSDLKIFSGTMEGIEYPLIPGHEWVGKVIEAPSNFKHLIGKRVVPDILCCCFSCSFCNKNLPNLCESLQEPGLTLPGGFAEFTSIKPENVWEVPEHISNVEASLLEPLAVAIYALKRVNVSNEDIVLIIGGGGIGQLLGQCIRLYNPKKIIIVDHHEYRLNLAKVHFADNTLNPRKDDLYQFFNNNSTYKPTKIYEVTGSEEGVKLAIDVAEKNAEIAIIGYSGTKTIGLKTSQIMVKHLTIKGVLSPTNTLSEAIDLVKFNRVNLKPLVTHIFELRNAERAFKIAEFHKHEALRVAFEN